MSDEYSWWRKSLELVGDCGKLSRQQMVEMGGLHEDAPRPGFYRYREKVAYREYRFHPVAIWRDGDEMRAAMNGSPANPAEIWVSSAANPITEETYRAVAERKEFWPGEGYSL